MNKEQLEALVQDGKLNAACIMFADEYGIPASELINFVTLICYGVTTDKP